MNKTALVTGASRGIGFAIATLLAKNGYDLYLTCKNNIDSLEKTASGLSEEYGISCKAFQVDMKESAQVNALFDSIPTLDLLINNAGIAHIGLLSDMSDAQWHTLMDTNISSMFYTCRRAIPLMLQKHSGKIINISSVWGNVGASMEVAYSASKGAVNSFTKALGKELAPSNIQVNALSLGVMDTEMNRCFSEEEMDALREEIPSDRLGLPSEAAEMILHLASAPAYLTGQVITMDGGFI